MSAGQRFGLIVFAMIVGGVGAFVLGDLLWEDSPGEYGLARTTELIFCIVPGGAIACGIVVGYLTRDRPDRLK
jgi:hypothetical protein